MLQLEHRLGVEEVELALAAPLVLAAGPQVAVGGLLGPVEVGEAVALDRLGGEHVEADAAELEVVPVKYSSTRSWARPIASKIWAPV